MSNLTVKFLDNEYAIPTDVVTYVGLVEYSAPVEHPGR